MKCQSLLLQYMGDNPKLRIMDFFLDNRNSDYTKKEVIEYTGISKTRFYKIWDEIFKFGFLKTTRRYGKAQLYTLDPNNVLVQKLKDLDNELGKQAMQKTVRGLISV